MPLCFPHMRIVLLYSINISAQHLLTFRPLHYLHRPNPLPPLETRSYLSARASLRTAPTIGEYLSILKELNAAVREVNAAGALGSECEGDAALLGVPVKWVKQQLPGAERIFTVR